MSVLHIYGQTAPEPEDTLEFTSETRPNRACMLSVMKVELYSFKVLQESCGILFACAIAHIPVFMDTTQNIGVKVKMKLNISAMYFQRKGEQIFEQMLRFSFLLLWLY